MFQIKVVQKIKTYILCSVTFFPPENHAVYGGAREDTGNIAPARYILDN
jgi:hypothetical protein